MRALLLVAVVLLLMPGAASARGLTLGFFDGEAFGDGGARLDEARGSGAQMIRVGVSWGAIAPKPPTRPTDPADPRYDWKALDAAAAAVTSRGMQPLLSIDGAPAWAEQGRRPKRYRQGTYKPDPRAVGAFATALARRYARTADYIQLWNEPNLTTYLAPQTERRYGRYVPFAAVRYRAMLNAAYPGVHAAGLKLVTAGTAPYGDPGNHGQRTRPLVFWRTVTAKKVRFDILSHHPYAVDGPRRHAYSKLDIAVPDVFRLIRLVRQRVRRGLVLPHRAKHFWVTEIAWDSKPPDPDGVPARRQAHWLADSFFTLWKQGVDHVFWYQIRDQLPVPSYAATNQGGVYLANGRPKLSQRAFAFPFSCERHGSGTRVWLKAPSADRVAIADGSGRVLRRVSPGSDRVATATVGGRAVLHAVSGATSSLSCKA